MPTTLLPPVRRVVTANGPDGRSFVHSDGPNPDQRTVAERPGYRSSNVWRTAGCPTPVDAADSILDHQGVLPPPRGTVLRVIDFPPRPADPEEARRQSAASFRNLFPDATHAKQHQQAGMHKTQTIDYAIVLSGTIMAVLDDEELALSAGDILIQRATNHAWENRSGEIARVCFVLIEGR